MPNSGQTCNAPSRMLVPKSRKDEAIAVARAAAEAVKVGDPSDKTADRPGGLARRSSTRSRG